MNKKYTFSAKAVMYIEDDNIYIEHEETGELIPVASLLEEFSGKECSLSVAYAEEIE